MNQAIEYYFINHADEMQAIKEKQGKGTSKFDTKKCVELFNKYAKSEVMD